MTARRRLCVYGRCHQNQMVRGQFEGISGERGGSLISLERPLMPRCHVEHPPEMPFPPPPIGADPQCLGLSFCACEFILFISLFLPLLSFLHLLLSIFPHLTPSSSLSLSLRLSGETLGPSAGHL